MKLTYWIAKQTADHTCYDIRATTKKACAARVAEAFRPSEFAAPIKVTIEYTTAFDLMMACRGYEDAGYWEA